MHFSFLGVFVGHFGKCMHLGVAAARSYFHRSNPIMISLIVSLIDVAAEFHHCWTASMMLLVETIRGLGGKPSEMFRLWLMTSA